MLILKRYLCLDWRKWLFYSYSCARIIYVEQSWGGFCRKNYKKYEFTYAVYRTYI